LGKCAAAAAGESKTDAARYVLRSLGPARIGCWVRRRGRDLFGHECITRDHYLDGHDEDQTMSAEAPAIPGSPDPLGSDSQIEQHVMRGEHRQALLLCTRHYAGSIGRLCMALLGSQAEAEDATQEILLEAHASFANWRAEGRLKSWLFTIARRRCARTLEKRGRRENRLRLVPSAPGTEHAEEWLLRRERAERARSAIEQIRPSEREALTLRYAAELSFREVGDACGIDEAAARKRVSRALARLRSVIESNE